MFQVKSFPVILFFIFLVLKLTSCIDWSWWWITVPLWGTFALLAIVITTLFIIYPTEKADEICNQFMNDTRRR